VFGDDAVRVVVFVKAFKSLMAYLTLCVTPFEVHKLTFVRIAPPYFLRVNVPQSTA